MDGRYRLGCRTRIAVLPVLWILATFFVLPGVADAASPSLLKQIGEAGFGAGQISNGRGVATDARGHIYVADASLNRVSEFTAWGEFVKAFGWDVAPGAVNEQQELRVRATAGQFRLTFDGATTGDLSFEASAEDVENALNGLASISPAGSVSVAGGPGGIAGTTPSVYVISFNGGPLAATDVDQLVVSDGSAPLSGGDPSTLHEIVTRADGAAAGTGREVCTGESGCKAAVAGAGPGQFDFETGVSVDQGTGDVYVFDWANLRVEKFDRSGRFLLMFGGGVNQTSGADICTQADLEGGDICGAGVSGSGDAMFSLTTANVGVYGNYISVGPEGTVFAGDRGRIQKFDPDGTFIGEISFAAVREDFPTFPSAEDPGALVVDQVSGDLYFDFAQHPAMGENERVPGIFRLTPDGELLDKLEATGPKSSGNVDSPGGLATDAVGNLYAVDFPIVADFQRPTKVVEFDADGNILIPFSEGFSSNAGNEVSDLAGLATNSIGDVLVSRGTLGYVSAYGPGPVELEPPPKVAPQIFDQFASAVRSSEATLKAGIDPKFWPDTKYYVEYGTAPCQANPCSKVPSPPGLILTSDVVSTQLTTEGVVLEGLEPNTVYFYRFVAESTGGGPVRGIGGKVGDDGEESSFKTGRAVGPAEACPANQEFRAGASGALPDCRAYEMVSPIDKAGADIVVLCEAFCFPAALNQSSSLGGGLTYSAYRAYGDVESAPVTSQYLAHRGPTGWSSNGISPPLEGPAAFGLFSGGDTMYKAFTEDGGELERGLLLQDRQPPLAAGTESPNLYWRNLGTGDYSALVPQELVAFPEVQGVTPDGRCAIFRVKDQLTSKALPGLVQLYKSCDGGALELVSILPGGESPSTKASSGGTPSAGPDARSTSAFNAISDDGSRIFWSEASSESGPLFVRLAAGNKTVRIGGTNKSIFWGASADGSRVVYSPQEGTSKGDLVEATVSGSGTISPTTIADESGGVMGMSEDATRVYFVSKADLDDGGPAVPGKPNLYVHRVGAEANFIATLSDKDVSSSLSPVHIAPVRHTARVAADGEHAVFMSTAPLTGYNNIDPENGEPVAEVFLYSAPEETLVCVSCDSTKARPVSRQLKAGPVPITMCAAAQIPGFENQLYGARVLGADGSRLFFESFGPLVPQDTNGKQDVYQWEALGTGGCDEGDQVFNELSGGCVNLISSGSSSTDASFVDASADGSDVFFATDSSLVPQDPGLIDIYDARVEGGFPTPAAPPVECEGETCQQANQPPSASSPSSSSFHGPGNPITVRRCPKGKHKVKKNGKVRCVKDHKKKHHRRQK